MQLFIIQHRKTREYLPIEFNTGGTYWEGEAGKAPRVFHSYRAASAFIVNWAKGRAGIGWHSSGPFGEPECTGVEYEPRNRYRSDLIIRECELVVYPEWAEPGSLWKNFRRKKEIDE